MASTSALPPSGSAADAGETLPLRERRRAHLRRQLSDTATALFLEHGFDGVTVADVAKACGVTEKTVFNHYRTKESLLVDRWPAITADLTRRVRDVSRPALTGVVDALDAELDVLTERGTAGSVHLAGVRRFGAMLASTPTLLDHRRRALDDLLDQVQAALVERGGVGRHDADLHVTAVALTGLVRVFSRSLGRHLGDPTNDARTVRRRVRADVRRAARLLHRGLPD